MTEPFDALHSPVEPVDPDPVFAAHLRAQIIRALSGADPDHEGVTMTDPTPPVGVVPYLMVSDGHAALAWYAEAFGAIERGDRYEQAGVIGHAEMRVSGAVFYLAEGGPEPTQARGPHDVSTSLVATVPDVDATVDRAVAAGARLEREPADAPYGRTAVVHDPYGHRWMLQTPAPPAQAEQVERPRMGDLSYATLYTPDVDRAATFYNTVLGWEVMAGSVPEGRQVTTTTLPIGLWGGQPEPTIRCCWLVDDVDAAVERVRAAGGTADVPSDEPYGRLVACVDNQGYAFDLHVPRPSTDPGPRTPLNGARPGDLSYLTLETPDHTTARAFYGSVLGWPAADDADPDVHPMLGVTDREVQVPRAVPMWKVADVAAAVERVRAAGGRADEPERKPYGISAYCTDDQGMAFYLGDA